MNIRKLIADRIGGINFNSNKEMNKFREISEAKNKVKKEDSNAQIIDLGIGEPDDISNAIIRDELKIAVDNINYRGYSDNGITEFNESVSRYMMDRFSVHLDPKTEVNHVIGAKSCLAMLPKALINPNDYVIMTIPGYDILGVNTKWINGKVFNLELNASNNFIPDLDKIPLEISKAAKIICINYPNNPTGRAANKDFYTKLVKYAKKHNILIVQDAAYIELTYNSKPLSILQIEGAKDIAVEVHSLSKSFNMTGWRIGFICGNQHIISAFKQIKNNTDSGQFIPIQIAAIKALSNISIIDLIRNRYYERLLTLNEILNKNGFNTEMPDGTFYLYSKIPSYIRESSNIKTAKDFSLMLLRDYKISTVPWDECGKFIRFSVTFQSNKISKNYNISDSYVFNLIDKRLNKLQLSFKFKN